MVKKKCIFTSHTQKALADIQNKFVDNFPYFRLAVFHSLSLFFFTHKSVSLPYRSLTSKCLAHFQPSREENERAFQKHGREKGNRKRSDRVGQSRKKHFLSLSEITCTETFFFIPVSGENWQPILLDPREITCFIFHLPTHVRTRAHLSRVDTGINKSGKREKEVRDRERMRARKRGEGDEKC